MTSTLPLIRAGVPLRMVVFGLPAPQGSKRHVGNGVMVESAGQSLKSWRDDVKMAALRAMDETPRWSRHWPGIHLHVVFTLPRPKAHFVGGRLGGELRVTSPVHYHATRPDLDKLIRATCDALTSAGAYEDDNRVCLIQARKTYPSLGRTRMSEGDLDRPGATIVLNGVSV